VIYIIETGDICDVIDFTDHSLDIEQWLSSPYPFNAACTIIPDAYLRLDSKVRTKLSTVLCAAIAKAKDDTNIILLAPKASIIDKRVRDMATVIKPTRAAGEGSTQ